MMYNSIFMYNSSKHSISTSLTDISQKSGSLAAIQYKVKFYPICEFKGYILRRLHLA